jgi:hypothetical protein
VPLFPCSSLAVLFGTNWTPTKLFDAIVEELDQVGGKSTLARMIQTREIMSFEMSNSFSSLGGHVVLSRRECSLPWYELLGF